MLLPLAATLISFVFSATVFRQWLRRHHAYQLVWAGGLFMFAIAAGAGYLARSTSVTETNYRVFYLFGAILNVAYLGLGTLYLLTPRRVARGGLAAVLLLTVVGAVAVFTTPADVTAAADTGKAFPDGSLPRILAGIGSGVGSLLLFGGALWSAWVFFRRRGNGRRAIANVIIAVGVFVIAYGGTTTLFTGAAGLVEITNLIGIAIMFAGFLLA